MVMKRQKDGQSKGHSAKIFFGLIRLKVKDYTLLPHSYVQIIVCTQDKVLITVSQ